MTTRVSGGMHPIIKHGTAGLIRGLAGLLASRIEGSGRRRTYHRRTHAGGRRLIRRPFVGTGYRRRVGRPRIYRHHQIASGYRRRVGRPRIHRHRPTAASCYRRRVGRPRIHRHRHIGGTWILPGRSIHRVHHRRRRITRVLI